MSDGICPSQAWETANDEREPMRPSTILLFAALLSLATACQDETATTAPSPATPETAETKTAPEPEPPRPPVFEDFQGQPQLSLFPRVGDFRPEDDSDKLPYWNTFIDHLAKMTGVAEDQATGNRAWSFRAINSIDSIGYFSPLAVEPQTTYRVDFRLKSDLAESASAGVGVLEFDEFLWIGEQYSEKLHQEHFQKAQEGARLNGRNDWREASFTFTTGAETQMIHLVLFREGEHDRNSVMFDDIRIEPLD